MEFPLRLRHLPDGKHRIAGILISGGGPTEWLTALSCWGVGTTGLRFLLISEDGSVRAETDSSTARGLQNASRYSVLVTGENIPEHREALAGASQRVVENCRLLPLLYQRVADRLYIPAEAELTPAVSEAELRLLLPGDSSHILVWHPSAGLIEFEPDQRLTAVDLLRGPNASDVRWDGACIGEELNDRIRSLNPEVRTRLVEIIGRGRGDIGQDAGRIDDAPSSPDEVRNPGLHDAVRGMRRWMAGLIAGSSVRPTHWVTGSGSPGQMRTWMKNLLSKLASAVDGEGHRSQRASEYLSSRRENELKRLLNLLDKDPDLGLRYALPFGGNSSRGAATPSGSLGERDPNFDIRQLRGSGPADAWTVPWEYQSRLIERYRDLAQREMRLGHHRRAAYIYAVLLNDLHAAATALEVGGLYCDAAAIYEKHLRNRVKAAECLRKGGFWEEAMIHFRAVERWIDAGELLLKLDRPEEARLMFRNEIDRCKSQRDFLRAGELADQRLNDPEKAAALFINGWKANSQPDLCFRALMGLYARQGQHAQAQGVLQNLTDDSSFNLSRKAGAVHVCSEAATTYPDEGVREIARRQTWHLASAVLSRPPSEQNRIVLAAVRSLSKADELLQRDVTRFRAQNTELLRKTSREERAKQRRAAAERKSGVTSIRHLGIVRLQPSNVPRVTRWTSGSWSPNHVHLLSSSNETALVAGFRLPVNFGSETVDGQFLGLLAKPGVSFERCHLRANVTAPWRVFLQQFPGTREWNEKALSQLNRIKSGADFVDVLQPFENHILDLIQLRTGTIWVLTINENLKFVLSAVGPNGLVSQEIAFDLPGLQIPDLGETSYRLCDNGDRVVVLAGSRVWNISAFERKVIDQSARLITEVVPLIEFPEAPLQGIGSPSDTARRLAFSFRRGAQAIWSMTHQSCAFAQDLEEPLLTFTRHGLIVAACQSTGRLESYRLNNGQAERVGELDHPLGSDRLLSLFPSQAPNEFHLVRESGQLEKFQIPVR